MHFPTRRLVALMLTSGLVAAAPLVHAIDMPSSRTSPARPVQDSAPAAKSSDGAASRAKGMPQPVDPMERLRERLSDKLGKKVAPDAADPDTVRVNVRTPEPVASEVPRKGGSGKSNARKRPEAAPKGAWSYASDTGPDHWARLRPEFATCGNGKRQSPIDIRDNIGVQLDPVQFDYKASTFGVLDNGRTIWVNVAKGNWIEVMGRRYQLEHVEFRHPAEERINGRQFDLGVHLVHKDNEGRMAVVAVLLDRGAEQPVIQSIWNNLPLEKGEELTARTGIDLSGLLPSDRRYFTYMGSMTTPPCREGVLWMVMKSPVAISSDQLAIFARLYPMNARPVQPANGRLIKGPQ